MATSLANSLPPIRIVDEGVVVTGTGSRVTHRKTRAVERLPVLTAQVGAIARPFGVTTLIPRTTWNRAAGGCSGSRRVSAFFASFKHESGNKDTAKRIRRTLRNRFERGGVVQTFPYGYIKAPDAKSDADVGKDPNAEAVYEKMCAILEDGASYAEVADWLNAEGWHRGGRRGTSGGTAG